MRARNLKPRFFTDSVLLSLPMAARLLFQGLWCIADRAGRLEDDPIQIKIDVFPADMVDVDDLLRQLVDRGRVQRYRIGAKRYLQISNFAKHQHPHRDERASVIPEPPTEQEQGEKSDSTPPQNQGGNDVAPTKHRASTVQTPCKHGANTIPTPRNDGVSTVQIRLTPDSGLLTADCLTPTSNVEESGNAVGRASREKTAGRSKKTRPRSAYPPDFYPDATGLAKAGAKGVNVATELTRFADWHAAHGTLMADWQAAWRTWIGNANPHAASRGGSETAYQRSQRERAAQFSPALAQQAPGADPKNLFPVLFHVAPVASH